MMFRWRSFLVLVLMPWTASAIFVRAVPGSWADFQTDPRVVRAGLEEMAKSYLADAWMPLHEEWLKPEEKKSLLEKSCLNQTQQGQWFFKPGGFCLLFFPSRLKDVFFEFLLRVFDETYPSYQVFVPRSEEAILKRQNYIQIHHPELVMNDEMLAQNLLSKSTSVLLWQMSHNTENCLGTALAAEFLNQMPFYSLEFQGGFLQSFHRITQDEDWEFGDLILFDIVAGGHAMVYVGTDLATGKKMVFSKNGALPSPYQMNRYEDIQRIYKKYGILEVKHYRMKFRSSELGMSNEWWQKFPSPL